MNILFQAFCPDCRRTVTARFLPGSLEALQKNQADIEVTHAGHLLASTHRWNLRPQDRANLSRRIAERLRPYDVAFGS